MENLGFTKYPPAYLSQDAQGNNLLTGANFASGASGYWDNTAQLYVSAFSSSTFIKIRDKDVDYAVLTSCNARTNSVKLKKHMARALHEVKETLSISLPKIR